MFDCRTCILRSIEAVAGHAIARSQLRRSALVLTPHLSPWTARRAFAAKAPLRVSRVGAETATPVANENSPVDKDPSADLLDAARAQVRRLPHDPVKFAEHVFSNLKKQRVELALALCRVAPRDLDVVVAWNHVVNYFATRGKLNDALKIFNEMKKRDRHPDSYTYTLLFRGFAQGRGQLEHQGGGKVVAAKAVALYKSMIQPNSRVQPGVLHTNAALRVCALAQDMGALWDIVGMMPESGNNSPDCITYTIIFDALRHMIKDKKILGTRRAVLDEGRRIWMDVVRRWRNAEIMIDGQLVLAMANLLLTSKRMQDWDDVLNLLQQTTGLDRLLPPLGSRDRRTQHVVKLGDSDDGESLEAQPAEDGAGADPTPTAGAFLSAQGDTKHGLKGVPSVPLSNLTLSAALEACSWMQAWKGAQLYWEQAIDKGVEPDRPNYHALLKLLKLTRASHQTVIVLESMMSYDLELTETTFRIAMAACKRDINNQHVVENAARVVEIMKAELDVPDGDVLGTYLSIMLHWGNAAQIMATLHDLLPIVDRFGREPSELGAKRRRRNLDMGRSVHLLQSMVGAIDELRVAPELADVDRARLPAMRSHVDQILGRVAGALEVHRQGKQDTLQAEQETVEARRAMHASREEVRNVRRDGYLTRQEYDEALEAEVKHQHTKDAVWQSRQQIRHIKERRTLPLEEFRAARRADVEREENASADTTTYTRGRPPVVRARSWRATRLLLPGRSREGAPAEHHYAEQEPARPPATGAAPLIRYTGRAPVDRDPRAASTSEGRRPLVPPRPKRWMTAQEQASDWVKRAQAYQRQLDSAHHL